MTGQEGPQHVRVCDLCNTTVKLTQWCTFVSQIVVIWSTILPTSGFRREVDEDCAILGYYAASNGNSLPMSRGQPIGPILKSQDFLTFQNLTGRLSRKIGKELPLPAA